MKITKIEAISLDIPIGQLKSNDNRSAGIPGRNTLPMLFVRVDTDDGLTGWGEAFAYNFRDATRIILEKIVIPACIGRDVAPIGEVIGPIQREFRNSKDGLLSYALSAIDIALWDIAGQRADLPLCRLLGDGQSANGQKTAIPAYASLIRYSQPERAADEVAKIAERGYTMVKLHESEFAPIAAARRSLGDKVPLMVDASSAWTVAEAVAIATQLDDLDIAWLEEPTWPPEDRDALAQVARLSNAKLAAGENAPNLIDFRAFCAMPEMTIVQPSLCKIGGISEMLNAMKIADAAGKNLIPHVYYLGPGLLASIHLIASMSQDVPIEHAIFDIESHPFTGSLDLQDGALPVPSQPGLGLAPNPDFIARYAVD